MTHYHSFWSLPYGKTKEEKDASNLYWGDRREALSCWALSAVQANAFFPDNSVLITDNYGAELAGSLGLPYAACQVILEESQGLKGATGNVWTAGKLYAMASRTEPYLHSDWDVLFLSSTLPDYVRELAKTKTADFCVQSVEPLFDDTDVLSHCYASALKEYLGVVTDSHLPRGLTRKKLLGAACSFNTGVFGVFDTPLFTHIQDSLYSALIAGFRVEQFLTSPYRAMFVDQFLLANIILDGRECSWDSLFSGTLRSDNRIEAVQKGYVHLIAGSKHNKDATKKVSRILKSVRPDIYEKIWKKD